MASTREKARTTEAAGAGAGAHRRPCPFCEGVLTAADFTDPVTLRRFVTDTGRIRARHTTGVCRRHQVQVAAAVKRAREMALLPHVNS